MMATYHKKLVFRTREAGRWKLVCETKFHRPHLKNVKVLLPVRQQFFDLYYYLLLRISLGVRLTSSGKIGLS